MGGGWRKWGQRGAKWGRGGQRGAKWGRGGQRGAWGAGAVAHVVSEHMARFLHCITTLQYCVWAVIWSAST